MLHNKHFFCRFSPAPGPSLRRLSEQTAGVIILQQHRMAEKGGDGDGVEPGTDEASALRTVDWAGKEMAGKN